MKERPILFSAPMIRALLDGRKTQTRRVAKLTANGYAKEVGGNRRWHLGDHDAIKASPYGQPGDRLWVRETFAHQPAEYEWSASTSIPLIPAETWYRADFANCESYNATMPWKPSIHMPRNLSRIDLEITDVRVEHLQDISVKDACAEGVFVPEAEYAQNGPSAPIMAYADLWETINGAGSWDLNPFVWVIEFKVLEITA
ncbi:MAG: hypothetical protein JO269_09805 [Burkholderiaceae bacterium]|nr:hypothetical protein [Burkholderiaceae bacterium]